MQNLENRIYLKQIYVAQFLVNKTASGTLEIDHKGTGACQAAHKAEKLWMCIGVSLSWNLVFMQRSVKNITQPTSLNVRISLQAFCLF
jgi:hypothetical protein